MQRNRAKTVGGSGLTRRRRGRKRLKKRRGGKVVIIINFVGFQLDESIPHRWMEIIVEGLVAHQQPMNLNESRDAVRPRVIALFAIIKYRKTVCTSFMMAALLLLLLLLLAMASKKGRARGLTAKSLMTDIGHAVYLTTD